MISTSFYLTREEAVPSNLFTVVTALMDINSAAQERMQEARGSYTPLRYLEEMRTVHVDAGRGAGKTTAIVNLYQDNDLVVCYSEFQKDHLIRLSTQLYGTTKDTSRIVTVPDLYCWGQGFRRQIINRVFVDDCRLSHSEQHQLNHLAIWQDVQQIVYLGKR